MHPDMTVEACRGCAGLCRDCPRPRLLPANVPIVEAYLDCITQWHVRDNGARSGMDYAGVRAAIEVMHPQRAAAALFAGIQVIERATLRAQTEWLAARSVESQGSADG